MYLEFSITSQSDKNPASFVSGPVDLSIGLIPADCPPNVTAGQWPHSVGLFSDGTFLVSGHERKYKTSSHTEEPTLVTASTTIGMLIYIPTRSQQGKGNGRNDGDRSFAQFSTVDQDLDDIDSLAIADSPDSNRDVEYIGDMSSVSGTDLELSSFARKRKDNTFSVVYNINGNVVEMNTTCKCEIANSFEHHSKGEGPDMYAVVSLISKNAGSWCRFSASDVVYKSRSAIGAPLGEAVYCLDGSLLIEPTSCNNSSCF